MAKSIVISGSGVFTPPDVITNAEIAECFNTYVERFNTEHKDEIEAGTIEPMKPSSEEFMLKAAGIKSRNVFDKKNILDPDKMRPQYPKRTIDEPSVQAEIAVEAARTALKKANKSPEDVDAIFLSCSNHQRPFPALGIEVQKLLGAKGFAFDMNVACSSATFGVQTAANFIQCGQASCALVLSPEVMGGQLNFRDRDSHFIFGEAATAVVVEAKETATADHQYEIIDGKLHTDYSTNIRNMFGFLDERTPEILNAPDKAFAQEGRKVFKDIVPLVPEFIEGQLKDLDLTTQDVKRLWLHQANINMNELIAKKILGHPASSEEAPVILDHYANTGSCGSVIAFDMYNEDLESGDLGVICSFGAGYSIGSLVLKKC